MLVIIVHDTRRRRDRRRAAARPRAGVGLNNVERRLACQYGDRGRAQRSTARRSRHDRGDPPAG